MLPSYILKCLLLILLLHFSDIGAQECDPVFGDCSAESIPAPCDSVFEDCSAETADSNPAPCDPVFEDCPAEVAESNTCDPVFGDCKITWREDWKCGPKHRLEDGTPATCRSDVNFCCSAAGWCGETAEHCTCSKCVDYRSVIPGDTKSHSSSSDKENDVDDKIKTKRKTKSSPFLYDDNPQSYWDQIEMKWDENYHIIKSYLKVSSPEILKTLTEAFDSSVSLHPLSCILPNFEEGRASLLDDCNNLGKYLYLDPGIKNLYNNVMNCFVY